MKKLDMGLMYDKIFRRTIFLRPLPDKTFEAIDITGQTEQYLKDKTGATAIDPTCIVNVRGIKRVDKIAIKYNGSPIMANMFDGRNIKVKNPEHEILCPHCKKGVVVSVPETEIIIPQDQNMTEKAFGDMLYNAEMAGRMQAERNPETDKKMNIILLCAAGAVLIGIFIFFKIKSSGG